MMRQIGKYIGWFLTLFLGGFVLLLLTGLCRPHAWANNLQLSASQFQTEGYRSDFLIQRDETYQLDNYTEAEILLESIYMDVSSDPGSILTNPIHEGNHELIEIMEEIADQEELLPLDAHHPEVIMGFRAPVRLLLGVMNIRQIRRLIMWVVMILFAANMIMLRREFSSLVSLLFAFSFLSVNPIAVMSSIQYSCCFILAFLGMLGVAYLRKVPMKAPLLFFIIGGLTQYFDYYTVPLLTFGLPMLVLLMIEQREGRSLSFLEALAFTGKCFGSWFLCYVLMWIGKQALTDSMTHLNAWQIGFKWLGSIVSADFAGRFVAVGSALLNLISIESAICTIAFLIFWPFLLDLRPQRKAGWQQSRIYLMIAILPLIWSFITAGSMLKNTYYEYRVFCMMLMAIGCFYAKPTHYVAKYMPKQESAMVAVQAENKQDKPAVK